MEEQNKVTQRWSKTAVTDIGTALLAEFWTSQPHTAQQAQGETRWSCKSFPMAAPTR